MPLIPTADARRLKEQAALTRFRQGASTVDLTPSQPAPRLTGTAQDTMDVRERELRTRPNPNPNRYSGSIDDFTQRYGALLDPNSAINTLGPSGNPGTPQYLIDQMSAAPQQRPTTRINAEVAQNVLRDRAENQPGPGIISRAVQGVAGAVGRLNPSMSFPVNGPGSGMTVEGAYQPTPLNILKSADTPILPNAPGLIQELSRPTTIVGGAVPSLSFAGRASAPVRIGAEAAGSYVGRRAGEEVYDATGNPILAGAAGLIAGVGTGALAGRAGTLAEAGVRALDDDAVRAGVRAAEGPLEASSLGRLRPSGAAGAVDPVIPGVTPRGRMNVQGSGFLADSLPDLPKTTAARTPEFEQAYPALVDSLRNELRLRRGGTVASEISAGRSEQAAGIAQGIAGAQGRGLDETLQAASAGARVGSLRKTVTPPLELTSAQTKALSDHMLEVLSTEQPFRQFNGLKALNALVNGDNVQPAQIKLLRQVFGEDVARLAQESSAGRLSATAQLDDAARAAIERGAEIGEKQIVRYEQRALAQAQLADDLTERLRLDPTNQRLANLAEQARLKGIEAGNKADELTQRQAARFAAEAEARNAAKAIDRPPTQAAINAIERADRLNPNEQQILQTAKSILGETESASALDRQAIDSMEYWLRGNRDVLDTIGETTYTRMADIAAGMSGNLADSYLTALYQRRQLFVSALENQGYEASIANKVANLLTERELVMRYPGGIPARLQAEIAKTKPLGYGEGTLLRGMASYSQEWKNLAFGPADVGVFGQQVLKTATMSPTNILAGTVNRTLSALNLPAVATDLVDDLAITKRLRYQLDGVPQGITTGIVQEVDRAGTALQHIPLLKNLDPWLSKWIEFSTDFQFRRVLGGLRNLNYEGNLVALHLAGQDITDASVRATAAGLANSATSYAPRALNTRRALQESATLMTPSMRRAQVTAILQMGRVFTPGATAPERILGSIAILNLTGSTLAVGKLLSDQLGAPGFEFEMDPSKPGFGSITTGVKNSKGENVILNLFPQQQVVTTILKATREIAEGDPRAAAETWAKLFISSSGPAPQIIERAAGFGYQPGSGYKFGDLNEGVGPGQRILNMLPLPPIFQSYINEGLNPKDDPLQFGLESAGVPNYGESAYGALDRASTGAGLGDFKDLTPSQQQEVKDANPDLVQRQSEESVAEGGKYGTYEAERQRVAAEQAADDAAFQQGTLSPDRWIENLRRRQVELAAVGNVTFGDGEREVDTPRDAYFAAIDAATLPNGEPNWEAVDEWYAAQTPEDQAYIDENTGLGGTPQVREYNAARKQLDATAYYEMRNTAWNDLRAQYPEQLGDLPDDYWAWRDAEVQELAQANVSEGMEPGIAYQEAVREVSGYKTVQVFNELYRTEYRHGWVVDNPDLARQAWNLGLFTPDKAEREFLQGLRQPVPVQ